MRGKDESHAAAGHATKHPKAPEIFTEFGADFFDESLGVEIACPWNDRLDRLTKIFRRRSTDRTNVAGVEGIENAIENAVCLLTCDPLGTTAQKVFLSDHFQNRTDVLRHAAMHEHQRVLEFFPGVSRDFLRAENLVGGHQASTANAELGVPFFRWSPSDELHARPNTARILPTAARATDPFS